MKSTLIGDISANLLCYDHLQCCTIILRYSNLTSSQTDVFKHSISQVNYLIYILENKYYHSTIKLSLISLIRIHNFQFNMIFVAFYLLVLGSLVDQNLGCPKCEGTWVWQPSAGMCGPTICPPSRVCVTNRDVTNYLLFIFVTSFL